MKKLNFLITGGAGYIGSHLANRLLTMGHHVSVIDNLSAGFKESLFPGVRFFQADLSDYSAAEDAFSEIPKPNVVYHLASLINVKESCENPEQYFRNNMDSLKNTLELCNQFKISRLVFASSGSVYGNQQRQLPFDESVVLNPASPYSESKVRCEEFLKLFKGHSDFKAVILRYSNVAGSALNLSNGQRTARPYHVFHKASLNLFSEHNHHQVYGNDYSTVDGTAIRDFIHIEDLIALNVRILNYLLEESSPQISIFNAGANYPLSVLEVFETVNSVYKDKYGQKKIQLLDRRPGDPPYLVSDSKQIQNLLLWKPQWTNRHTITVSSVQWLEKLFGTGLEPFV